MISIVDEQDLKGEILAIRYIGVNSVIFVSVICQRPNCFIMNQQEKQFQVNCWQAKWMHLIGTWRGTVCLFAEGHAQE